MFSLSKFESYVPAKILARGKAYFEEGVVDNLEETEKGRWEAVVYGSAEYGIEIRLKGQQVLSWNCDCPYEDGDICKHVVAALYALRDAPPKAAQTRKPRVQKLTFEDILLQLSVEELRAFIRHQKSANREFANQFLLFFSDKDPRIDVATKYREMVRQLIRKHSDRGFMDYRSSYAFSKAMTPVVQIAAQAIIRNNFREAISVAQVVCLEVMQVLQHGDDSAGNISGLISDSIYLLDKISKNQSVAPDALDQLLAWLEKHLQDPIWFDYGNFGYELLEVARSIGLRLDPDRYLHLINQMLQATTPDGYTHQTLIKEKIYFLQTIGRQQEVENIVSGNMDIVEVRHGVVKQAMEQRDFARAKQLVAEGIAIATLKKHPGTVSQWEEVLMEIAHLEHDIETFRSYAKKFAFQYSFSLPYYEIWKSSFAEEEWPNVIEQHIQSVIADIHAKPRTFAWESLQRELFYSLSPIYVVEGQWDRLLHLLPPDTGEKILSNVHPYLAKRYPKEMLAHYLRVLATSADRTSSRSQYKALAELMQKVKRDIEGSHAPINELAAALIQKYPRRPAMVEELEKVLKWA